MGMNEYEKGSFTLEWCELEEVIYPFVMGTEMETQMKWLMGSCLMKCKMIHKCGSVIDEHKGAVKGTGKGAWYH